ncbi:MAG: ADP-ribosylglycohydrolase family protein [Chloroflexi bacterium]|nr:ADP-ribosylglycohydrolase family protein [Chloroflexota bacterium]
MELEVKERKFIGAMLGLAIGDAMGIPVKGMNERDIRKNIGPIKSFLPSEKYNLPAGQYSELTQLAIALATSIMEVKHFKTEVYVRYLVYLLERGLIGHLKINLDALELLKKKGRHSEVYLKYLVNLWDKGLLETDEKTPALSGRLGKEGRRELDSMEESLQSGAAVRVVPLGLLYYNQNQKLRELTTLCTSITHRDSRVVAGALAVAFGTAMALKSAEPLNKQEYIQTVSDFVRLENKEMAEALLFVNEAKHIYDIGIDSKAEGNILQTVPAAFYCFIHSFDNYYSCILSAVSKGGDSDTIGAIAGALCGAYNGVSSIPLGWRENVKDAEYITEISHRLANMKIWD